METLRIDCRWLGQGNKCLNRERYGDICPYTLGKSGTKVCEVHKSVRD